MSDERDDLEDDRTPALVQRHLDGLLTEGERAELDARLAREPHVAAAVLMAARLEEDLGALAERSSAENAPPHFLEALRVEARTAARRRARRWAPVALVTVAAAAAVLVLGRRRPAEEEQATRPVRPDPTMSTAARARVHAPGARLALPGRESHVQVGPAARLEEDPRGGGFTLVAGTLSAFVGRDGREQRIGTPQAMLRVRPGTDLALEISGEASMLDVRAGEVAVVRRIDGATATVRQGARLVIGDRGAQLTPAPLSAEEPPPGARDVRFALDFERAHRPPRWDAGRLRRCPPGGRSRGCLFAERYSSQFPLVFGVRLPDWKNGLFDYDDDLIVAFDYWLGEAVGEKAAELSVYFSDGTNDSAYSFQLWQTVRGRWGRFAVRLRDFRREHGASPRPSPGDRITNIQIGTRWNKEDTLFIDALEVYRPAGP